MMATTGMQVFEIAMALSDNLVGGIADTADNTDYKDRVKSIINSYLPELYPYSSTSAGAVGRPVPTFLSALTDTVDLDDTLAQGVLVHGIVAMLFVNENPALSSVHEQKYLEKLARLKNVPIEFAAIDDVYPDQRMYSSRE